jgi:hypothetical protein
MGKDSLGEGEAPHGLTPPRLWPCHDTDDTIAAATDRGGQFHEKGSIYRGVASMMGGVRKPPDAQPIQIAATAKVQGVNSTRQPKGKKEQKIAAPHKQWSPKN